MESAFEERLAKLEKFSEETRRIARKLVSAFQSINLAASVNDSQN